MVALLGVSLRQVSLAQSLPLLPTYPSTITTYKCPIYLFHLHKLQLEVSRTFIQSRWLLYHVYKTITLQCLASSSGCSQSLVSPSEVKTRLHKLCKWGGLTHRGTKTNPADDTTLFLAQAYILLCEYIIFTNLV